MGSPFGPKDDTRRLSNRRIRRMVTAFLCLALTVKLTPTDDVWVYSHASDQVNDTFLRVWGAEGAAVTSVDEQAPASWSLLQFDLAGASKTAELSSAKLVLHHIGTPSFGPDDTVLTPLEVRPAVAGFNEKTWNLADAEEFKPAPGDNDVFGFSPVTAGKDDKPIRVEVDLLAGKRDFRAALKSGMEKGNKLALALTSRMEITGGAQRKTYKFFSRSAAEELRPSLVLTYKD